VENFHIVVKLSIMESGNSLDRNSERTPGIIYPNDNGENLIEYIVLCKQSMIISY
jgi:hypothetical protein